MFGDSLTITGAGWVIEGYAVTSTFSLTATESLIDLDSANTTLRNNRFTGIVGLSGGNVVGVTPPAACSNNLIVNGATVEQIQSAFFASAEYTLRFASNVAFVHSLYRTLFARNPSQAEVDSQVAQLPSLGRQGVAANFLASSEYRTREVTALYSDVLRRTAAPTAGEMSANVNSGLDLLGLRVLFAGTAEFYENG